MCCYLSYNFEESILIIICRRNQTDRHSLRYFNVVNIYFTPKWDIFSDDIVVFWLHTRGDNAYMNFWVDHVKIHNEWSFLLTADIQQTQMHFPTLLCCRDLGTNLIGTHGTRGSTITRCAHHFSHIDSRWADFSVSIWKIERINQCFWMNSGVYRQKKCTQWPILSHKIDYEQVCVSWNM